MRRVPVSPRVIEALEEMNLRIPEARAHTRLFPNFKPRCMKTKHVSLNCSNTAFRKIWHSVCNALELPEYKKKEIIQRHSRHTFGIRVIAEEAMSIEMLKSYFGHTSYPTTEKYIGPAEQMNNRAVAALDKMSWF